MKVKKEVTGFCLVRTDLGVPQSLNGRFLWQSEADIEKIIDLAHVDTIGRVTVEYWVEE